MTAPYYQQNAVTLYRADCGEFEIPCDLIVTDPPYGQEFKSGKSDLWGRIHGDDDLGGTTARVEHALKSLRRGRHIYIFGTRFEISKLDVCGVTEIIWDKATIGMGDLSSPWGPQHE